MRRVLKYPFNQDLRLELDIPKDARLVLCATQGGLVPVLWFEIDDEQPTRLRLFRFFGTGHMLPKPAHDRMQLVHVGSCMTADHALVWHVYELLGLDL